MRRLWRWEAQLYSLEIIKVVLNEKFLHRIQMDFLIGRTLSRLRAKCSRVWWLQARIFTQNVASKAASPSLHHQNLTLDPTSKQGLDIFLLLNIFLTKSRSERWLRLSLSYRHWHGHHLIQNWTCHIFLCDDLSSHNGDIWN